MIAPRATMLAVALIASLAAGGGAAAGQAHGPSTAGGRTAIDPETGIGPAMEHSNGCGGDDRSFEGSVD